MSSFRSAVLSCLLVVAAPAIGAKSVVDTDNTLARNAEALNPATLASSRGLGPHQVGRRTLGFIDTSRDNRLLVMDVWYPVAEEDAAGVGFSSYDLVFTGLESEVALDSPAVAGDAPYPLLVFSHGNLGIRFQSFFLTEALASHGFIVVAVDHAGNTAQDLVFDTLEPFEVSAFNRPLDISFAISTFLSLNDSPTSAFSGRIDAQRIGLLGHSFGGYTALATASGIDGVAPDLRVKALAPFAPASGLLTDAQLQNITLPTLILGGTSDITTPIDDQSSRPFELIASEQRTRVDLVDAGHQSFTNICILSETLIDAGIDMDLVAFLLGNADEGCAPELMPIETAQDLSVVYMVAFMKVFVSGDERYARFLTPAFSAGKQLPAAVFVP